MHIPRLGKAYRDGDCIVKQGEPGDCMYVVQQGQIEVVREIPNGEVLLATLERGDVFGEMALFTKQPRSATVRARGKVRVLTIDKRTFLKRIHEDPSLAYTILQKMSQRIQALNNELLKLKTGIPSK